jgi:hypothetical protein
MNRDNNSRRPRVRGLYTSYRNYRIDTINKQMEEKRLAASKTIEKSYKPCHIGDEFWLQDIDH